MEPAPVDEDFQHLFKSWFNRGFLVLRPITWQSPANILEKIIEYETLVMTVKDLDKYYKALDSALHQYHSTKIVEINTYVFLFSKARYVVT
mgnify:CR=1 FL=1